MILNLRDLYPTCPVCCGDCVGLSVCDESAADPELDYFPCKACKGLGSMLVVGGHLLLEILRLGDFGSAPASTH